MDQELTPKQQAAEAIREAQTILVIAGKNPSGDQVASVVAMAMILRKLDKKVTALISDNVPDRYHFMPTEHLDASLEGLRDFIVQIDLTNGGEVDKLKYDIDNGKLNIHVTPHRGGFSPKDTSFSYGNYNYDLIIVLGVPQLSSIDTVLQQNPQLVEQTPIINIDFYRKNEQYGAVNLIDDNASSLAEILLSLAESLQQGIVDGKIATALLTGIIAATDRFAAKYTTAKTMTVAAQLIAAGGDHQKIIQSLYGKPDKSGKAGESSKPDKQSSQPRQIEAS